MTTYLTGKVMSNYDGSPILTDNLIWQMAKKGAARSVGCVRLGTAQSRSLSLQATFRSSTRALRCHSTTSFARKQCVLLG